MSFPWTEAQTELLRKLWAEGLSCSQISARMTIELECVFTRNAIIGRIHRLHIQRITPPRTNKRKIQAQLRKVGMEVDMQRAEPIPEPEFLGPLNDFPPRGTCRYIKGDVGKTNWQACGHPAMSGRSWCRWHWGVVFQPAARVKAVAMPEQVAA